MRIRNTETLLGYIGILVVSGVTLSNVIPIYLQEPSLEWFFAPWALLISALFGEQALLVYWLSYLVVALLFMFLLWRLSCAKRMLSVVQQKNIVLALLLIGLFFDESWLILATLVLGFYLPIRQASYCLLATCLLFTLNSVALCFGWIGNFPPLIHSVF